MSAALAQALRHANELQQRTRSELSDHLFGVPQGRGDCVAKAYDNQSGSCAKAS